MDWEKYEDSPDSMQAAVVAQHFRHLLDKMERPTRYGATDSVEPSRVIDAAYELSDRQWHETDGGF